MNVAKAQPAAPANASTTPWLTCRACHRTLVQVSIVDQATCLELLGGQIVITAARITCACGAARQFKSAPVDSQGARC